MKKDNLLVIIAAGILAVLFIMIVIKRNKPIASDYENTGATSTPSVTTSTDGNETASSSILGKNGTPEMGGKLVTFNGMEFVPAVLKIGKGDTVTFRNASARNIRPASDPHPSHTDYPGTSSKKCGTAGASLMFDSCDQIAPGDSWTFKFNEVGAWTYHDHLSAAMIGTIVVK